MKHTVVIFLSLFIFVGCDSGASDEESMVEYMREGRAGDMKMLGDVTEKTHKNGSKFTDHPLQQFFVPHGTKALQYVGSFWHSCDEKHTAYTEERCDQAVDRGIRIGKSIGINLTKKDLVDPLYWQTFRTLDQDRITYFKENIRSASMARNGNGPSDFEIKDDEFKEKEEQMMQGMDEHYGL